MIQCFTQLERYIRVQNALYLKWNQIVILVGAVIVVRRLFLMITITLFKCMIQG